MSEKEPIRAAVVTVSDTREPGTDLSGDRLAELLEAFGAVVAERAIVKDDVEEIVSELEELVQTGAIDLVITTGGTGFAPRDNTPEATDRVIERAAPGIAEAMRRETAANTPMAMLSRSVAGISGATLIINFPGSKKAVEECFAVVRPVLGHAVDLLRGETGHATKP